MSELHLADPFSTASRKYNERIYEDTYRVFLYSVQREIYHPLHMGGVAGKGDVEIISPAQFSKPGPERAVFTYTI